MGAEEVEAPKLGPGTGATFDKDAADAEVLIFLGVARRLIVSADTGLDEPTFLGVVPVVGADEVGVLPGGVLSAAPLAKSDAAFLLAPPAPDPDRDVLLPIA
jgi:hypothetical protein